MTEALQVMTSEKAHEREQRIISLAIRHANITWQLGKEIYEGIQEKCFIALGYQTPQEWILDPNGIGRYVGKSVAYRDRALYEKFVIELGIPQEELEQYDPVKLEKILPLITPENKDDMIGLLDNSRQDLEESLAELKGRKTPKQERFENGFQGGAFKLVPVNPGCEKIVTFGQRKSMGWVRCEVFPDGEKSFMVWIEG